MQSLFSSHGVGDQRTVTTSSQWQSLCSHCAQQVTDGIGVLLCNFTMLAFNVSFIYPIYSCVNNNLILIKVEISAKNILKNSYSHLKLYFEVYINPSYMPFEFIHAEHNTRCETMVCILQIYIKDQGLTNRRPQLCNKRKVAFSWSP